MTGDWISRDERLPTEEDGAEHKGCVMGWHKYSGWDVVRFERVRDNSFFIYWMRLPDKPKGTGGDIERPKWKQ